MSYPHTSLPKNVVFLKTIDLPAYCPQSAENLEFIHPRVAIPLIEGEGVCPYCGTLFVEKKDYL